MLFQYLFLSSVSSFLTPLHYSSSNPILPIPCCGERCNGVGEVPQGAQHMEHRNSGSYPQKGCLMIWQGREVCDKVGSAVGQGGNTT